jgi:co-chaperonin GroES (HSP10)
MATLKVNPTKVLIQDITATEEKTKGGLIIPGMVKIPTMRGTIILVGDGTPDIQIKHQVGDIALFNPGAGSKLMWDDKEYRLVDISEIFLSGIS